MFLRQRFDNASTSSARRLSAAPQEGASHLRINSLLLPLTTLALIVMQIVDSAPIWQALLVALGGAWLISYLWARSLRKNLFLERSIRFGWAQWRSGRVPGPGCVLGPIRASRDNAA